MAAIAAFPVAAHGPAELSRQGNAWYSVDPYAAVVLALTAFAYARGHRRLARGTGAKAKRRRQARLFWAGWAAIAVAVGPPLESWSAFSFAAHMAQHELMMLVAAPLLAKAMPLGVFVWGLPNRLSTLVVPFIQAGGVRATARWLCTPVVAWTVHALVLWGWHVPPAFEASLASEAMHWLQHATFFLSALMFWRSVFGRGRAGDRRGAAVLSLLTTAIHSTALGTLLTFSERIWYPTYAAAQNEWGLSAIEDQQLGGLIMCVPGGAVFILVALALVAAWLRELGRRSGEEARR